MLLTALLLAAPLAQERPGSWLERFQLAEARLDAGELDAAATALESCLELAPENATTAYHLACAHARAGRSDDALDWLERAVAWGWSDADVLEWDADLAPLRGTERYRAALAGCRARVPDAPRADARILFDPEHGRESAARALAGVVRTRRGELRVLDRVSGELLELFPPGSADLGPGRDGSPLAGIRGPDGTRVVDALTGETVLALEGDLDLQRLFLAGDRVLGLARDALGQRALRRWTAQGKLVPGSFGSGAGTVAVAPDGRRALVVDPRSATATLYDAVSGERMAQHFERVESGADAVGFLSSRRAWVLTRGQRLYLIDARSGKTLRILPPWAGMPVRTFAPDPSREAIALGDPGIVRWWSAEQEEPLLELRTKTRRAPRMELFDEAGILFTSSEEDPLQAWDVATGELRWTADSDAAWSFHAAYPPDGALLLESQGVVEIVDPRTGRVRSQSSTAARSMRIPVDYAWAPDGSRLAALFEDGTLDLLDPTTARAVERYPSVVTQRVYGHPSGSIEFSSDGRRIVAWSSGLDGYLLWDLGAPDAVSHVPSEGEVSPDARRQAVVRDEVGVAVLELPSGEELLRLPDDPAAVHQVAWSGDGRRLAVADGNGRVQVLESRTGAPSGPPIHLEGAQDVVALSPDGETLLTGDNPPEAREQAAIPPRDVRLWSVASGATTFRLDSWIGGLSGALVEALFDPSGERAVCMTSGFTDIYVFDLATGALLWTDQPGCDAYGTDLITTRTRVYTRFDVFDLATGRRIEGQPPDTEDLVGSLDDRWAVDRGEEGELLFLDGATLEPRYSWALAQSGSGLASLPNQVHRGDLAAVRGAWIVLDGEPYPLDGFAPWLYDPKRFLAGVAGVPQRRGRLPRPPRLLSVEPRGHVVRIGEDPTVIRAEAVGEGGVLGFQIELDDRTLPHDFPGAAVEATARGARLTLTLDPELVAGDRLRQLRLRPIGASGTLGRPARFALVRE